MSFTAGQKVRASELRDALGDGAWTTYVPTLQGTGGFAEGSKTNWRGKYTRVGRHVTYRFDMPIQTGFAQGTGAFYLADLPVTPAALPAGMAGGWIVGSVWLWSASATALALARLRSDGRVEFLHHGSTGGPFAGAGAPWAWGLTAQISGTIAYEAAL